MVEAAIYFPAVIITVAIIICITILKLDACLVQTRAETVTQEQAMQKLGCKYDSRGIGMTVGTEHLMKTSGNRYKTSNGDGVGVNRVNARIEYTAILPVFFEVLHSKKADVEKEIVTGFSADMPELIRASDMMRHYPDFYLRYTKMPYYIYRDTITSLLSR